MSGGFRQSQAGLHSWSGLLLGWVLFIVFVTGTVAFWREGLNRYMRPELARVESPMRVLAGAQRFLADRAGDAQTWFITLPPEGGAGATVFWVRQPPADGSPPPRRRGRRDTQAFIDANGAVAQARDTRGGEFFYRFHFDLHYMPVLWARWLVGFAAMAMLVAILSGIVTHKKIFRDFFTLRRGKGTRSWLDGHNALGVLALPFHLMITYTGLVTLMAMLMPWATVANYADEAEHFTDLFPAAPVVERTGRPAPLADLTRIARDAEGRLGGPAWFIEVSQPGDAAARVSVIRAPGSMLNSRTPRLAYDGVTGRPVWRAPDPGGAAVTAGAMIGLHAGRYADDGLRWLYFLCGVAGSLMVASGLVMWTVKRRDRLPDPARPHLGFRIVERLNIAVIAGFPLGIAALFWANRLLPVALAGRAGWEVHALFMAWGAAAVVALVTRPVAAWTALLGAAGALFAGIPVYNLFGTERGLFASVAAGDWLPVGVDLTMLAFGAGFVAIARRVAAHRPAARRPRRAAPPAARPATTLPEPAE